MPLYEFVCAAGHKFERFLRLVNCGEPQRCECGVPAQKLVSAPFVRGDTPDYVSPVTGEVISGRRARRNDLARHHCIEYEPGLREHNASRRASEEAATDSALDHTLESQLAAMPARKKELLEQELRAGADLGLVRATP